MDKLRKHLEKKKKLSAKFNQTSQGSPLSQDESFPSRAAQARKELERRQRLSRQSASPSQSFSDRSHFQRQLSRGSPAYFHPITPERFHKLPASDLSVRKKPGGGVYFTCELLGEHLILSKEDMTQAVEDFLDKQFMEDPLVASVLMVHSLNPSLERRQMGIETLCTYVNNLIQRPNEEKFRRIRLQNRAFQDRVGLVKGGKEFLLAAGFEEKNILAAAGTSPEMHLIFNPRKNRDLEHSQNLLRSAKPIALKVYRNRTVLKPTSKKCNDIEVPDSFFEKTAQEIKMEQQAKTEEVDQLLTLRTKQMRGRNTPKIVYKYCLVRVNFPGIPGDLMLQGTFGVGEKYSVVLDFVRESLQESNAAFYLKFPTGKRIFDFYNKKSIGELGLPPASLLYFQWEDSVLNYWKKLNKRVTFLRADLMKNCIEI